MLKHWIVALALALALALPGCASMYKHPPKGGVERAEGKLEPARLVLVAVPADGAFGSRTAVGSGQIVAQRTAAEFGKYANRVDVAAANLLERASLLNAARERDAGYLVIPTIAHWERRATILFGIPSKVGVSITVIDTETGQEVTSALLYSESPTATLLPTGPEQLLPKMIGDHVRTLYVRKPGR